MFFGLGFLCLSYISFDIIFKNCLHYLQDDACTEIVYPPFGGLSHSVAALQCLVESHTVYKRSPGTHLSLPLGKISASKS